MSRRTVIRFLRDFNDDRKYLGLKFILLGVLLFAGLFVRP